MQGLSSGGEEMDKWHCKELNVGVGVWHEVAPVNAIRRRSPPFDLLEIGGKKALQRVKPLCTMYAGRVEIGQHEKCST